MAAALDLCGPWEFWPDPEGIGDRRGAQYQGFRGGRWRSIRVPGFWQEQGVAYQGTAWYRRLVILPDPLPDGSAYLEFDGVDYHCEAWWNGAYLGFHAGGSDAFSFAAADRVAPGPNLLTVRVEGPLDPNPERKQVAKGATYHWDCLPVRQAPGPAEPEIPSTANARYPWPVENPAGIWRPVRLAFRAPVHIAGLRVIPYLDPSGERADIHVELALGNDTGGPARVPVSGAVAPDNFAGGPPDSFAEAVWAPPGESRHTLRLTLDRPSLWWTWDLGFPHLYRLTLDAAGDRREVRFGVRSVARGDDWQLTLNGHRFFARGTNYMSDRFLSRATPELYRSDMELVRRAHMNMVRVFAHPELDDFYDLCDEEGVLVFQDLPFQWGYDTSGQFIERAAGVADRLVRRLSGHPSIFLWCCHSESRLHDFNKLDEVLVRTVRAADPTRPVLKDSVLAAPEPLPAYFRHLRELDQYSRRYLSVIWAGWYWGRPEDVETYTPLFVTEFGTQAVPDRAALASMLPPGELWPPNWRAWMQLGFQLDVYERNLGPVPERLDDLIQRSQAYQAEFYKLTIEALRRKKYRPVNGLLQFHLVDNWPAITWSVADYFRRTKPGYDAVKSAFAPVLLSFTAAWPRGGLPEVSAWVVNDLHRPLADLRLRLTVAEADGRTLVDWDEAVAEVAADSAGTVLTLPVPLRHRRIRVAGELYTGADEVLARNTALLIRPSGRPAPIPSIL